VVGKAEHFKENTLHATRWSHISDAHSTRTESTPAKREGAGGGGLGDATFLFKDILYNLTMSNIPQFLCL